VIHDHKKTARDEKYYILTYRLYNRFDLPANYCAVCISTKYYYNNICVILFYRTPGDTTCESIFEEELVLQ